MKVTEWVNIEMLRVIGWSIIHSLWQFLILFAALKVLLLLISKGNPRLRYFIGIVFLTGSVVCSTITFYHEYKLFFGNETHSIVTLNPVKDDSSFKSTILTLNTIASSPGEILLNFLNTVSPYLTFGWIMGVLLYLVKIANGGFYLHALRKLPAELYPEINKKMKELADKMGISRNINLIINNSVLEPLTFGHLRPVILLPCSYIAGVPFEQLEMILAHELAHIKRYDYIVNLLQIAMEAIYFFNPFFRAMSNLVRDKKNFAVMIWQ